MSKSVISSMEDLGEISNDPEAVSDLVYHIHKTFNSRIMVLFTSIKALSDTSKLLKEKLGEEISSFCTS